MISYELAKKLKKAGFPQGGNGEWFDAKKEIWQGACDCEFCDPKNQMAYIPTLSELIEACGDGFSRLIREKKDSWSADGWYAERSNPIMVFGKTPEETVAKLWLKLNE